MTRAEWASFLLRAMYPPDKVSRSNPFGGEDGSVHEIAIGVRWEEGLTTGCGIEAYCPNDQIARERLEAASTGNSAGPRAVRDPVRSPEPRFGCVHRAW
jgi:hypothetical protein